MHYLVIALCALSLLVTTKGACTAGKRFCPSGTFVPYNYYKIIEGEVSVYQLGFFRFNYETITAPIEPYLTSSCASNHYQADISTIQAIQVGNDWDPFVQGNSYTLNYTDVDWTTAGSYPPSTYKYVSLVSNTYEGCLITAVWYRKYDAANAQVKTQMVRGTYTIKTHINYVNDVATEFHCKNSAVYSFTGATLYPAPCKVFNKYYFHPYLKIYFYFNQVGTQQSIAFTCFPYNSGPTSACDADFNAAGTPTFKSIVLAVTTASPGVAEIHEYVAFSKSTAYVAVRYRTGANYQSRIYKLDITTGASCADYTAVLGANIYYSPVSTATEDITYLDVIPNVGLGFVRNGIPGIWILRLDASGNAGTLPTTPDLIENTYTWKLFQPSIDTYEDTPLFAVASTKVDTIYRVTNIATLVYTNTSLDFYNYPVDVGRFHFMAVYPGKCSQTLAGADYDYAHAVYLNTESKFVDFCTEEVPKGASGNGIMDSGEECDDGNSRDGDGCSSTGTIELGWRCSSTPFSTKSLCEKNECGDSFINSAAPENEVCDDGNKVSGDGCSYDCHTIERGYFCGRPGKPCIKVCSNSLVDNIPGWPYNIASYTEVCDDGNDISGDGCTGDCMTIETGYECPTPGVLCNKICGNGIINGVEECDDGNNSTTSDGCTNGCIIQYGYKCSTPGAACYKACGDGVADTTAIPGTLNTAYAEQCDDGNLANGDGCSSICTSETLPRTYTYDLPDSIVREREVDGGTSTVYDCKAPYLPAQIGPVYNPRPGAASYVCYIGKYCFDCTTPKFPGYPVVLSTFLEGVVPYTSIPTMSRGRMRAVSISNLSVAFSFVSNNKEVLISNAGATRLDISHGSIGATRQSWGKYFLMNSGTTGFSLYELKPDTDTFYKLLARADAITKPMPPQLGMEFYIWWPVSNFVLSRSYNVRNFEILSFDGTTLSNGPYVPEFVVNGNILFDPVFRNNQMYLPIYTESTEVTPTKTYKVVTYTPNLPWEIKVAATATLSTQILSLASFSDGVVATLNAGTNNFINIDTTTVIASINYNGTAPTCTFNWRFAQSRPSPNDPNNYPQAYAYCSRYTLYPATYTTGTLLIDVFNAIPLPDDNIVGSRNKAGRYNLQYPFDINGRYLVNFAVHPCTSFVIYRWDEWYDMSVSIYDLVDKTTKCVDVTNTETAFDQQ